MDIYRFGRWGGYTVKSLIVRKFLLFFYKLAFKLIQIITDIEMPCEAKVKKTFIIGSFGGVIISEHAKFGNICRIRNAVGINDVSNDSIAVAIPTMVKLKR